MSGYTYRVHFSGLEVAVVAFTVRDAIAKACLCTELTAGDVVRVTRTDGMRQVEVA